MNAEEWEKIATEIAVEGQPDFEIEWDAVGGTMSMETLLYVLDID
jgi:hypothetical protein